MINPTFQVHSLSSPRSLLTGADSSCYVLQPIRADNSQCWGADARNAANLAAVDPTEEALQNCTEVVHYAAVATAAGLDAKGRLDNFHSSRCATNCPW